MSLPSVKKVEGMIFNGYQVYQGLRILRDRTRLDRVLALSDALLKRATQEDLDTLTQHIRWSPEAVAAIEERYRLEIPEVDQLLGFPENSLGREFGRFLQQNGINPAEVKPPEVSDDLTYLAAHLAETHDLWHLVTGFSVDLNGEAGVAAFAAAQYASPFQYAIIAGTLLTGVHKTPWDLGRRMDAITRGWTLGKKAYPLLGIRWDEMWELPLADVRRRLGIACDFRSRK